MRDLVVVATYWSPINANLAKSRLETLDIPAMLSEEETTAMNWVMANAIGGIKLHVHPQNAAAAVAALRDVDMHRVEPIGDEWRADGIAADGGADDEGDEPPLNEREALAKRTLRSALLALLFLPLQFYVTWMVWKVFASDLPLNAESRRAFYWAAAINLTFVFVMLLMVRYQLAPSPYDRPWDY